jgi:hypothetical protein
MQRRFRADEMRCCKRSGQPSSHDVLVQRQALEAPEYGREMRRRRAHGACDIDGLDVIAPCACTNSFRGANQPPSCFAWISAESHPASVATQVADNNGHLHSIQHDHYDGA